MEVEKFGRDSDEIRRPYYLEWLIGTGQFVTQEELEKLVTERKVPTTRSNTSAVQELTPLNTQTPLLSLIIRDNRELKNES